MQVRTILSSCLRGQRASFAKNITDPHNGHIQRDGRIMLFWRAKSAKQTGDEKTSDKTDAVDGEPAAVARTEAVSEATPVVMAIDTTATIEATVDTEMAHDSNVVSLPSPKLADRLAGLNGKTAKSEISTIASEKSGGSDFAARVRLSRTHASLRALLADSGPESHVLILGSPGTGRRSTAGRAVRW